MLKKSICTSILFLLCVSVWGQNFTTIWDTNNTEIGSSANNQVIIPTNPAYTTYNYDVDWGDGTSDTGVTGNITHTYATPGIYTISIGGTFPSIYFNNEKTNDKLKIIEILAWGNIQWQTMENAFYGCANMNFDAIAAPDLSQVTSLKNMFRGGSSFNGIVNDWDVSTITDISGLFYGAIIFNRPLDLWVTSSITDMNETFNSARQFNEPLDNWNTGAVTTMSGMFGGASSFNQNINNWNVSLVTNMSNTFRSTNSFNLPLNNWNVSNVTDMSAMFSSSSFNKPIENWDVSKVTNMSAMFSSSSFNKPIENWDVSSVTNFSLMFQRNRTFNHPLNAWNVTNATNMSSMFDGYYWSQIYNQPLDSWDVSNVTDMSYMFRDNSAFNQDISGWDVSNVTNMTGMFAQTDVFNQDISGWNVSNVTNMYEMFYTAKAFNQPLNNWNMSNVNNVASMFYRASSFNQPLNLWNLSSATSFHNMFNQASSFNQDITGWNTSNITSMSGMFTSASSFNQNLGFWDISSVSNMTNMLSNSNLSQENYDNTLIAWSAQPVKTGITLGATNLKYCDGLNQRQSLIDNSSWTIVGDAVNCSYVLCTSITMPHASDTATPANSDIRWDPAPNATGYKVTLEIERGGVRNYATISGNTANNYDVGNTVGLDFTNEFMSGDTVYVTVVPYNDEGDAVGCQEINFTVVESWVNNPDAFKLTYDTTLVSGTYTTPTNQLKILTNSNTGNNYNIDWGDGQYDNNVTGNIIHTYLTPGIYTVSIIGDFTGISHTYYSSDAFKLLSIDQWGSNEWESMRSAFSGCQNMEYMATDIPNLSKVTDMSYMFNYCSKFNGDVNNWDVSNVTNMAGLFAQTQIYNKPLNNWNTANVTDMNFMFGSTKAFNQNIDNWVTSSLTDTNRMFYYADVFNQPLNSWDVSNVTDMSQMFNNAKEFNQPLFNWDVENVLDMEEMFENAEVFNQNIDRWNVGNVTTMNSMFYGASAFNEPLNSWNVSSVNTMLAMFRNATVFNQPLDSWNVSTVNNMSSMFSSATAFNQNINSWNVTNVTNMYAMFYNAISFNQPLNNWDVNSVVTTAAMFSRASVFNQPLNNWDVSAVANMISMFEDATMFNQPLDNWNVSSVTLMESMFEDAEAFNQNLNNWNTAVVTNFEAMFKNALTFNQPMSNWNTGEALTMEEMFSGATAFNQNINSWDVSFVSTMEAMFKNATTYNQPMNSWNVASVTTMEDMFKNASAFNENIGDWNVRKVTTMEEMFNGATAFNQNINNWRITGVNNMDYMFRNASAYNQPMDLWNPGTVTMRAMFYNAITLNQSLAEWDISNVTNMLDMLDNTALVRENYDNTLIAWSEQTLTTGITLGAEGLPYCDSQEERQSMIDNFGWTFDLDIRDCPIPSCTQLTSPLNGDIDVPLNTNITWEHALYAEGYRLTVGTTAGGNDIVNNITITNETSYEFASDFNIGDIVYVTLIPFNTEGDAVGPCTEESFTISNSPATTPECTNLIAPLHAATDIPVTTDLSWNPISNADGYKITVGTSTGASDILNAEDVGNVTSYDFTVDLPEDSDIFVLIIPYNGEGDAVSCSEERFHTEIIPVPPMCTMLTSPLNGATNVAIDSHLNWTAISNATGYLVSVGTTAGGIEIINNIDVGNFTTYDIPVNLQESRLHYVTIIPYNDEGDATGCTEETFTTGDSTSPPSCTTLTSPTNGETAVDISTNLTWTEITSATGYKLAVGTSSGNSDIFSGDVSNALMHDLAADLPENTTIFVTVIPYNGNGDATGCVEESFTTETIATIPNCTNLTLPTNGDINTAVDTDLSWSPIANATGYKLTVGTTSGGSDILNNEDVGNFSTYNFTTDLPENTTIYVNITPYNTVGDATGCAEESFTTETIATIPNCTNLTLPANGNTNTAIDTDLSWNPIANATGYKLTVGTTSGGSDILNNEDVGNFSTYNFTTDLPENTTIYVNITPYNTVGDATGCVEESFTTETIATIPNCTNLTLPANGDTNTAIDTDLSWNPIANATGYKLTVGTTSGGSDILNNEDVGNFSTYNFTTDLPENTTIYVNITPYNTVGDATGCVEESFTTETIATIPNCTNLTLPTNGDINTAVDTDLSWNPIANATGYKLTVGTTSGGSDILNNEDVGNFSTYNFTTDLPENTTIYVSITPYNTVGDATGCVEESFTTETIATIPNCTNLTLPANGDTNTAVDTDLSWNPIANATGYKLTVGTTSGGSDILNNEDVGNFSTYNFTTDLPENTTIYVNITPYNTVGDATGCAEESFTTETIATIPNCTNLTLPANGDTNTAIDTDLSWNPIANATGYKLTVGTTSGGSDILNNEDVGNFSTYNFTTDLPENTTIYVNIIPYNTVSDATGCAEESFTTETIATIPNCTNLTLPANGDINTAIDTDLSWSPIANATGYKLTVGTTSGGSDILNNEDVGFLTSYNLSEDLPEGTKIFINITPYNAIGNALLCSEMSFTTKEPVKNDVKYGFSPDGDGINEYWHIEGIENHPDNVVYIYNRWGDLVFEIQGYDNASKVFKGIANKKTKMGAKILPDGTYFFKFTINQPHNFNKLQGFLVLKR